MTKGLRELVAAELGLPVDPRVAGMAEAIASLYPGAARGVLFYGSCLRSAEFDGLMLDFYLVVSSYEEAYGKSWLARANRLIPPNVFPFAYGSLIAKYAVLSEADLMRECGPLARSVSVWARFAQPSRLVWSADADAAARIADGVALAAPTLLSLVLPVASGDVLDLWRNGFSRTYRAELRAERSNRSASIVDAEPTRYRAFGEAALRKIDRTRLPNAPTTERLWRRLQRRGKQLSVLRLAKASFTFAGGVDYLAWKVSRHSGVPVAVKAWHRRFPLAAAVVLLPRLLARGAVR